jgi:kynurenine formamidase
MLCKALGEGEQKIRELSGYRASTLDSRSLDWLEKTLFRKEVRIMCSPTCLEALYGPASRRGFVKKSIMAAAAWLGSGRWGVEAVANLDALPAKGAILVLGGPKVQGGTGGPSRVIALV